MIDKYIFGVQAVLAPDEERDLQDTLDHLDRDLINIHKASDGITYIEVSAPFSGIDNCEIVVKKEKERWDKCFRDVRSVNIAREIHQTIEPTSQMEEMEDLYDLLIDQDLVFSNLEWEDDNE